MPSGQSLRRVSASEPATRPAVGNAANTAGRAFSCIRLRPASRADRSRPAAASNRARGPARTARPSAAWQAAASELALSGPESRLKRPEGQGRTGGQGEGGIWALLTCWYRLPQAGSTAARAANANPYMAQPATRGRGRASELKGARALRRAGASRGRLGRASGGSRWPPPLPGQPLSSGSERRRRRRRGSDAVPGEGGDNDDDAAPPPRPRLAQRSRPVGPGLARRCCCPPWAPVVPLEAEASESVPSKTGCRSPQRGRRWWWVPGS